jgi:hypothetical protein
MSTAVTVEPYEPLPAPCYFAHQDTNRITVVYGGLANYYGFYDVEVFKGTDPQDEAQLADPANWQYLSEDYYVEAHPGKASQVFAVVEGTSDTITYQTGQYPGPFRLEGIPPFAGNAGYEYFATLSELLEKQLVLTGPQFTGHIVPHRDQLAWVAFTAEPYGSGECPWYGIELNLGAPLDSYAYYHGRRATAEEGEGHGTATLWRQVDGARQYYVEINPADKFSPTYPKLTPLTLAQVQQWYKFEFTPLD